MPEPLPNPYVAENNARNLRRPGAVLDRPTGELALLWNLYARLLERETQARRQSNRKQRRERERTAHEEDTP